MLKKTILPLLTLSIALSTGHTHAEGLTDSERERLNKRLQKIIDKSEHTLAGRQATAYKAYKKGLSSSSAAFDLYLNCVEKVNFTDQGKKNSKFRDWKRKNKEKHSESGFRLALRHQLNWLVLTIDASRNDSDDYSNLSPKALAAIDSIFDDGKALKDHNHILKQSVLSSMFARAYGFGNYKVENWSQQPLNITTVFEKVILPSLREDKKSSQIRSAWLKSISYQEKMIELWSPKPEGKSVGMKKAIAAPELMKFTTTQRPKLIWSMELDVFKSGDESGAAARMLNHISKNYTHNDATKWAEELGALIAPKKKVKKKGQKSTTARQNADNSDALSADDIDKFTESEDDE